MFSRSLYIVKDVRIGDTITEENIRSIRPGFGGHPKYLKKLIGEKFKNNFFKGERFTQEEIRKYLK
jgi:pseudaminic acid synthase